MLANTHTYTHAHTHTNTYPNTCPACSPVHPAQESGGASAETFISGRLAEQVSGAG